jgi:hypothetical protein
MAVVGFRALGSYGDTISNSLAIRAPDVKHCVSAIQ